MLWNVRSRIADEVTTLQVVLWHVAVLADRDISLPGSAEPSPHVDSDALCEVATRPFAVSSLDRAHVILVASRVLVAGAVEDQGRAAGVVTEVGITYVVARRADVGPGVKGRLKR